MKTAIKVNPNSSVTSAHHVTQSMTINDSVCLNLRCPFDVVHYLKHARGHHHGFSAFTK